MLAGHAEQYCLTSLQLTDQCKGPQVQAKQLKLGSGKTCRFCLGHVFAVEFLPLTPLHSPLSCLASNQNHTQTEPGVAPEELLSVTGKERQTCPSATEMTKKKQGLLAVMLFQAPDGLH